MEKKKVKERKPQPPVLKRTMVSVYKYMALDKDEILTEYSKLLYDKESALDWYENFGKNCEELFNRKLHLTELRLQKQYR